MRRTPASSARSVAFAAAVCALGVAAGCGRVAFDLLPDSALAGGGQGAGMRDPGLGGGAGTSGKASGGGGAGGGGSAGRPNSGGFGGRFGGPGGSTGFPCLGEGGCADEEPFCPPYSSSPFCLGCLTKDDCAQAGDAKVCDPQLKRCVQCRRDPDCDMDMGEACNSLTQRCAKACERKDDCAVDSTHLLCNQELHVCVACNRDPDCGSYGHPDYHCFLYSCVQCVDDHHCMTNLSCVAGRCVKR